MANRPVLKNSQKSCNKSYAPPPDQPKQDTRCCCDDNHYNRRYAKEGNGNKRRNEDHACRDVDYALARKLQDRLQNKGADGDPDAGKCILHNGQDAQTAG